SEAAIQPEIPHLSVVLIVYRMARQAMNTIYTLSPAHQREVEAGEDELIVVEHESDSDLDERDVRALGPNIDYVRRAEAGASPARAANEGLARCPASNIGLLIAGARMVTPRAIRYALDAFAITSDALVAVPGYHVGHAEHHRNLSERYDEEVE